MPSNALSKRLLASNTWIYYAPHGIQHSAHSNLQHSPAAAVHRVQFLPQVREVLTYNIDILKPSGDKIHNIFELMPKR